MPGVAALAALTGARVESPLREPVQRAERAHLRRFIRLGVCLVIHSRLVLDGYLLPRIVLDMGAMDNGLVAQMTVQELNTGSVPRGAYGFRVKGLSRVAAQLVPAPAHWPALEIAWACGSGAAPDAEFGEERACLPLRTGGWIEFERVPSRARLVLPSEVPEAAITHPLLGIAAVVPAYWLGCESFHAGAFAVDGEVWAVVAEREAGKSSLIASLALAGFPIVCDDVLVLSGMTAFAGPRSADLRGPAAAALGVGEPLGRVGDRDRWRMALGAVAPELPLRGWITLRWDERTELRPLRGAERLRHVVAHRAFLLAAPDPGWLIERLLAAGARVRPAATLGRRGGVGGTPRRRDQAAGTRVQLVHAGHLGVSLAVEPRVSTEALRRSADADHNIANVARRGRESLPHERSLQARRPTDPQHRPDAAPPRQRQAGRRLGARFPATPRRRARA